MVCVCRAGDDTIGEYMKPDTDLTIMQLWQQLETANPGQMTKQQLQEVLDTIHTLRIQGFQKSDAEVPQ